MAFSSVSLETSSNNCPFFDLRSRKSTQKPRQLMLACSGPPTARVRPAFFVSGWSSPGSVSRYLLLILRSNTMSDQGQGTLSVSH